MQSHHLQCAGTGGGSGGTERGLAVRDTAEVASPGSPGDGLEWTAEEEEGIKRKVQVSRLGARAGVAAQNKGQLWRPRRDEQQCRAPWRHSARQAARARRGFRGVPLTAPFCPFL